MQMSLIKIAATMGFSLCLWGCAGNPSSAANSSSQNDSITTVSADPMGAQIFGSHQHESGDYANLDRN